MKLIKFGKIYENDDGFLCFENFHIDCENETVTTAEAILTISIERLQDELNKHRESSNL